jgi:hypothetical protein
VNMWRVWLKKMRGVLDKIRPPWAGWAYGEAWFSTLVQAPDSFQESDKGWDRTLPMSA